MSPIPFNDFKYLYDLISYIYISRYLYIYYNILYGNDKMCKFINNK